MAIDLPTLNWPGKDEALKAAQNEPYRLLEFDEAVSCGDSSTENIIVQGDNLAVMKALLPYYRSRVKCIYIDPPYNTGAAFETYDDNFEHSQWLSMIYPRLELLRDFLTEDGAIFISIDDNEQAYLKVICDEIFGRSNFVASIIWERAYAPVNLKKHFSESHDYIVFVMQKIFLNLFVMVCREMMKQITDIKILIMIHAVFGLLIIYQSVRLLNRKFMKLQLRVEEKFYRQVAIVGDWIKKNFSNMLMIIEFGSAKMEITFHVSKDFYLKLSRR